MKSLSQREWLKKTIPNHLVRKKVIEYVRSLCEVKFKYRIIDLPYSAEVDLSTNTVYLARKKKEYWQKDTYEELIHDVLHEVVHILAKKKKIYPAFHCVDNPRSRKEALAYIRTALKAERWVDREALRWGREMFPGLNPRLAYETKADVKWFQENVLNPLREEWGIRKWRS